MSSFLDQIKGGNLNIQIDNKIRWKRLQIEIDDNRTCATIANNHKLEARVLHRLLIRKSLK